MCELVTKLIIYSFILFLSVNSPQCVDVKQANKLF